MQELKQKICGTIGNNCNTKYQLENVFVKHYAPNHMLAPKENLLMIIGLSDIISQKKDITQSIMYGIYSKFVQFIYTLDTNFVPNIMILSLVVIHIVCSQCPL